MEVWEGASFVPKIETERVRVLSPSLLLNDKRESYYFIV